MRSFLKIFLALCALLPAGFSGCTTGDPSPSPGDPRTAFVGSWMVSSTAVKIYNFANAGTSSNPAIAEVSSTTITLVPDQVIGDGWIINGGGSMTTSTLINWGYTLNDGATLHNLVAVYTKQ
jgi:hypothetical protein